MSTSTTTISIPASTDLSFAHQVTPSVSDLVTAAMGKGPQAKVAAQRLQSDPKARRDLYQTRVTTFLRESVPAYDARFSQTRLLFHGHRYLVQLVKENIANPRRANWSELVCHTIPENGLTPEPLSLLDKI